MSDERPPGEFRMTVPADLEAGVYADVVAVQHNQHGFTLDFGILQPAEQTPDRVIQHARVVARVRVSPTLVFEIARVIADNVDQYERRFGPISRGR